VLDAMLACFVLLLLFAVWFCFCCCSGHLASQFGSCFFVWEVPLALEVGLGVKYVRMVGVVVWSVAFGFTMVAAA